MAGDLTDYGLPDEARVLAKELTTLRIPTAAVLGNHDDEREMPAALARMTGYISADLTSSLRANVLSRYSVR